MISAGKFISDIGNHNDIITEMRDIINKQAIHIQNISNKLSSELPPQELVGKWQDISNESVYFTIDSTGLFTKVNGIKPGAYQPLYSLSSIQNLISYQPANQLYYNAYKFWSSPINNIGITIYYQTTCCDDHPQTELQSEKFQKM